MGRSIVCGVDGSPDSRAALRVAADLAKRLGAKLVLAHVIEHVEAPDAVVGPMGTGTMPRPLLIDAPEQKEAGDQLLAQIANAAGVEQAERRVVFGFAGERLADLADEEQAELVVVGSRGRGAFKAAFLGSVSTNLIGAARCPVLVVPPGAIGS
jgi:nucleotide-binding universal stress UspA family protein